MPTLRNFSGEYRSISNEESARSITIILYNAWLSYISIGAKAKLAYG